jgi:hypothetical protein
MNTERTVYRMVVEGNLPTGWTDWFGDLILSSRSCRCAAAGDRAYRRRGGAGALRPKSHRRRLARRRIHRRCTILMVCVPDQTALHGLLGAIRDLNMTLISLDRTRLAAHAPKGRRCPPR